MPERHGVHKTWIEVGADGPIRTVWYCHCGNQGSAWGKSLKANDRKIVDLYKKHARVQGGQRD